MEPKEIVERLKAAGWTGNQIATAVGVSPSVVSNIANGRIDTIDYRVVEGLRCLVERTERDGIVIGEVTVRQVRGLAFALRYKQGLHVREIAEHIGIPKYTLSRILCGKQRKMPADILGRLKKLYDEQQERNKTDSQRMRELLRTIRERYCVYPHQVCSRLGLPRYAVRQVVLGHTIRVQPEWLGALEKAIDGELTKRLLTPLDRSKQRIK